MTVNSASDLINTCPCCDSPAVTVERQIVRTFDDARALFARLISADWSCADCSQSATARHPYWLDHSLRYSHRDDEVQA